MTNTAKDKQEYLDTWNAHIEQLQSLIWATDDEDGETLFYAICNLKQVVKNNAERTYTEED